jgi:hypothetical protein
VKVVAFSESSFNGLRGMLNPSSNGPRKLSGSLMIVSDPIANELARTGGELRCFQARRAATDPADERAHRAIRDDELLRGNVLRIETIRPALLHAGDSDPLALGNELEIPHGSRDAAGTTIHGATMSLALSSKAGVRGVQVRSGMRFPSRVAGECEMQFAESIGGLQSLCD